MKKEIECRSFFIVSVLSEALLGISRCMQKYYGNKLFVLAALMFLFSGLSFADEPVFPGKNWENRTPESQNIDSKKLSEAIEYLGEKLASTGGVGEVVIIRNGYMIHKGDSIDKKHCIWSCTKSFTSTILGHLIENGKCTLETLGKDYVKILKENYPDVTLRHFATMTSGYDAKGGTYGDVDPDDGSKPPFDPTIPAFKPGELFSYFDDAMRMNGYVLTMIAGTDLESYFKEYIAGPIGMNLENLTWKKYPRHSVLDNPDNADVRDAAGGVEITARELARFGLLFLNNGKWQDKQVINSDWVKEATKVQVPVTMEGRNDTQRQARLSRAVGRYGYNWWLNTIAKDGKRSYPDAPSGLYLALGYNNNVCFVIPEWDMVIVRMGVEGYPRRSDMVWNEFLKKIGEAISDNKPVITGEKKVWQTVTIDFKGPHAGESDSDPNPFLDYKLQTTFIGPNGQTYNVPGFFDGDGKGGKSGDVWRVRFTPDEPGDWFYKAVLKKGGNIAVNSDPFAGKTVYLNCPDGTIRITSGDKNAEGFLGKGRLVYEKGKFYLKTMGDCKYWIKGGTDSPENFLAYSGFVNTTANPSKPEWFHDFNQHVKDWKEGDPDWDGGKGKGIIGALNYLSSNHVNSIYVLLSNIGGDGQDVWPYSGSIDREGNPENDNLHFDIMKLRQWEIVFAHAQRNGINLLFVLNEGEKANKRELDDGKLGIERKLFYHEMIARFSHHNAIQWNLCEEYDIQPFPLEPALIKEFAGYIAAVDPYKHPITVHNCRPDGFDPFLGDERFSLTSLQYYPELRDEQILASSYYPSYGDKTEIMRIRGKESGHPIPISIDEFNQATIVDEMYHMSKGFPYLSGQSFLRKAVTWPVYLSGGAGIEFISEKVLELNDFRLYEKTWQYTWNARKFMEEHLPFWEMEPNDNLLSYEASGYYEDGQVFAKRGAVYAVYLPDGRLTGTLDMRKGKGMFALRWHNPRTGGFEGETKTIEGGKDIVLGNPPAEPSEDWVVLIKNVK